MQQESTGGKNEDWQVLAAAALKAAKAGNWKLCQQICAQTAEQPPPALMAVSRLNILICQYRLGSTSLIPERALPLLPHLPLGAALACLGLSLLAARKSGTLLEFKRVAVALADERYEALDLPTVPTFVLLHERLDECTVVEHIDASLMSEAVAAFLDSGNSTSEETAMLQSLARRYRERAAISVASHSSPVSTIEKKRAWWKLW